MLAKARASAPARTHTRSPTRCARRGRALLATAGLLALVLGPGSPEAAWAQASVLTLDGLPRPSGPPLERGPVVPAQVERWRQEAKALEYGDNGSPRDPVRAAELYCRAARHGDAESQYSLAWMLTNSRGIERDEAQAAHLFAAAAEQGMAQARNILARMGPPRGAPPACLRPPEEDKAMIAAAEAAAVPPRTAAAAPPHMTQRPGASAGMTRPPPPPPRNAPDALVRFVNLVAPDYQLEPYLVLAFIATESNFDAAAVSPKNAQGLMQLIPETATRFGVRNALDPAQNVRGGMAYLRWLMARFQGDVVLVAAAYNAGEAAVERYLGVPPYAETRKYVWKIVSGAGGLLSHPFDASVTPVSTLMPLMRTPWRVK